MDFKEMVSWLEILRVKCSITEETWNKMDENTRKVFMSDVRIASITTSKDKNVSTSNN